MRKLTRLSSPRRRRRGRGWRGPRRDYVGAALWHHTARSTEYFSRWIEMKETGRESSEREKRAGPEAAAAAGRRAARGQGVGAEADADAGR